MPDPTPKLALPQPRGNENDTRLNYIALINAIDDAVAPASKGVTNGDTHDHAGGDGALIPAAGLAPHFGGINAYVYTATATFSPGWGYHVDADASSNSIVVLLPLASGVYGMVEIRKLDPSLNTVAVAGQGGDLINGGAYLALTEYGETVTLRSDGTGWMIVGGSPTTNIHGTYWVPTLTQGASITIGGPPTVYVKIGKLATVSLRATALSAGTATNAIYIGGIPAIIAPAGHGDWICVGSFSAGIAPTQYTGSVEAYSASQLVLKCNGGGLLGNAPAATLANGDVIGLTASWECA